MISDEIFDKYDLIDVDESFPTPDLPNEGITLLVGSSGSGKSTILRNIFGNLDLSFDDKPIWENFSTPEQAERLLISCGLRSIPAWKRSYQHLSNGEAHRAFCAKSMDSGVEFIDEFTSVVDRNTAKSLSASIRKHFDRSDMTRLVIATCHRDIIDWLCPDHVYDTDSRQFLARGSLRQRPDIQIKIRCGSKQDWVHFKKHHYLASNVSSSCHFYVGYVCDQPVAFSAVIHGCGRDIRTYWRESRVVVIPEWQGLGIGARFSDAIATEYVSRGKRFFSKTAHPAFGEYREKSNLWRPTSTNKKSRPSYLLKDGSSRKYSGYGKTAEANLRDAHRVCYSHEFIGENK